MEYTTKTEQPCTVSILEQILYPNKESENK